MDASAAELAVVIAAEGAVGSSPVVFFALATMLDEILRFADLPPAEATAWRAWDAAWARAQAWALDRRAERNSRSGRRD